MLAFVKQQINREAFLAFKLISKTAIASSSIRESKFSGYRRVVSGLTVRVQRVQLISESSIAVVGFVTARLLPVMHKLQNQSFSTIPLLFKSKRMLPSCLTSDWSSETGGSGFSCRVNLKHSLHKFAAGSAGGCGNFPCTFNHMVSEIGQRRKSTHISKQGQR